MGLAVVGGRRPVLVHRGGCGHVKTVCGAAIECIALAVRARHQVELAGAKVFGAEEGDRIGHGTVVDGVTARVGEVRRHALDDLVRGGHVPMAAVEIGGGKYDVSIPGGQPCMRLMRRQVQDPSRLVVRFERLALLDADRLQRVDHRLVAGQPRLGLHEAVQRVEEPRVVRDRRVEQHVDRVDERRLPVGRPPPKADIP